MKEPQHIAHPQVSIKICKQVLSPTPTCQSFCAASGQIVLRTANLLEPGIDSCAVVIVSAGRARYFPFRCKKYRCSTESSCSSTITKENDVTEVNHQVIHCKSQLKEYVDNVFLSVNLCNESVYERSELSSEQVFQITCQYTTLFKNNTLGTFTNLAKKKTKARYLKAYITRKRSKEGRVERKILYVMKPDDRAFLANNISNYQYRYEEHIKSLKMDGYDVIGYARKSPTKISDDELEEIIKNMISCLRSRSQVTDVYVSSSSRSKSPITAKDMTTDKDYTDIRGCVGNTQSLLTYFSSTTKKVCLVIVDYAALSTDPDDILLLIKNYKSLECIIVDRFKDVGKYEVYRRNDILKTPEQLAPFDCRPKLPQRSV